MNCRISRWYGRLGNNIIQVKNAIVYGFENKCNVIIPKHDFFNKQYVQLFFDIEKSNFIKTNQIFFSTIDMKRLVPNIKKDNLYKKYMSIIKRILQDLFIIENKKLVPMKDDEAVLHIRSGDVTEFYNMYVPPPLSYYVYILKTNKFRCIHMKTIKTHALKSYN